MGAATGAWLADEMWKIFNGEPANDPPPQSSSNSSSAQTDFTSDFGYGNDGGGGDGGGGYGGEGEGYGGGRIDDFEVHYD